MLSCYVKQEIQGRILTKYRSKSDADGHNIPETNVNVNTLLLSQAYWWKISMTFTRFFTWLHQIQKRIRKYGSKTCCRKQPLHFWWSWVSIYYQGKCENTWWKSKISTLYDILMTTGNIWDFTNSLLRLWL